jgi:glyoxylase-like metal-dependent hydrolase (beta-lactamase superfamily II)
VLSVIRHRVPTPLCLLLAAALPVAAQTRASRDFALVRVSDGVYAAIRADSSANVVHGNTTIIVNDADVVVVDAAGTPAAARRVIRAVQRLTHKPVRYLVNTHWHDDHTMGNQAWVEAYPGLEIVGHPETQRDLTTTAVANRAQYVTSLPGILDFIARQLAAGNGLDGTPLGPGERASLLADTRLAREYLAEAPSFRVTPPTLLVRRRFALVRGDRTIEIRHLGWGNTPGDLIVYLPGEQIVVAGDLVVWPTPFVFDSHIASWQASLDSIRSLGTTTIIPGHGPVMRDFAYVDMVAAALRSVEQQVGGAKARGLDLSAARKTVDLAELRRQFTGDSKVRRLSWENYFVGPAVERAFEQADSVGRGS